MDPLSVSASVAGLLTAAAQISSLLIKFANSAKGAPKQAQSVLIEVKDISGILHHVQLFLLGQMAASRSRASMLLVEQLLVTLTGCVITFSELEDILTDLKTEGAMHTLDRINWARKESKIAGIISRLQNHKSSLNLMLTILEWFGHPASFAQCSLLMIHSKSRAEAERSVDRLCELVEEVLANNIDMAIRLRGIESRPGYNSVTSAKLKNVNGSEQSTIVSEIERPPKPQENINLGQKFRSAFEEDLDKSKVYKRALYNSSQSSVISSAARSTATSVLSGLSLGDVSIIAVFALPLYSSDITNNKHYAFGDVAEQPLNLVAGEPREVSKKPTLKPWKQSSSQILGRLMSRGPSASPSTESEPGKVFGVALETSLNYARIEVVKQGNPVITAYIPIVVARCALFLKEHGRTRLLRSDSCFHITDIRTWLLSNRCQGLIPSERIMEEDSGATGRLRPTSAIRKGFGLEWLYDP